MAEQIKNLGKVFVTPEGEWDINKEYDRLALVNGIDTETNELMSFISRQAVPAGSITLDNKLYWQKFTSKVHFEDITLRDDGWIYIGDEPVYQVTLHDAIGQAVVDKIEESLTEKIMSAVTTYMTDTVNELKRYMGGVVNDFVAAITNQITRLIVDGIKVNNINSGSINQNVQGSLNQTVRGNLEVVDKLQGEITINDRLSGTVQNNVKGSLDTKQSGEVLTKLSGGINAGVVVQGNIDNNLDGKVKVEHEGTVNNINSGSINSNVAVSGGIKVDDGEPEPPTTYTITVNSNPNTAKVTLDGVETHSKAFVEGSTVLVVVSQEGYITQTRTISNLTQDTTINITLVAKDPSYFFGAQPLNNYISADGGTIDCLVVSLKDSKVQDYNYTAEGDIIDTVNKLESNLIITIKQNTEATAKSGRIVLTQVGSNKQLTVLINQSAGETPEDEFVLTSSMTSMNFEVSGGTINPGIVSTKNGSNIGYTISSKPDWITENNGSFTASNNTSETSRGGSILIVQNESYKPLVIQVSQPGVTPTPKHTVTVNTTPSDAIVTLNGVQTKVGEFDAGSNITVVTSKPGYITDTRTITNIQQDETLNITLEEEPQDEYIFIAQTNPINVGGSGEAVSNIITSTKNGSAIDYTIGIYPSWINITKTSNGISLVIDKNYTEQSRTATVVLTQNESGNTISLLINQSASTIEFSIDSTEDTFSDEATDVSHSVVSTVNGIAQEYSVTPNESWINYDIFETLLRIGATENTSTETRIGTVTLTQNGTNRTITITIIQLGKPAQDTYVFETDKSSISIVKAGGSQEVNVTSTKNGSRFAGLSIINQPSWITVAEIPTTNGTKYTFTAGENTSIGERSGNITIKQTRSDGTEVTKNVSVSQPGKTLIITKSISDAYGERSGELTPLEMLNANNNIWQPFMNIYANIDGSEVYAFVKSVTFASGQVGVEESWATVHTGLSESSLRIERNGNTPSQNFRLRYNVVVEIRENSSTSSVIKTVNFDLDWNWNPNN